VRKLFSCATDRLKRFSIFLVVLFLLILSCSKNEKQNDFSSDIESSFRLIEKEQFGEAEKILKDIKIKDPNNCPASWGMVLLSLRRTVDSINSILSIFFGFQSAPHNSRLVEKGLSETIQTIIRPIFEPINEIFRNIPVILAKKCSVEVALPVEIGPSFNPIAKFYVGEVGGKARRWGPAEAALGGFISGIITSLLKFVLAINFDINIEKLFDIAVKIDLQNILGFGGLNISQAQNELQNISLLQAQIISQFISLDPYDTVALFGSLAYIIDQSPDFLKIKSGAEPTLDEIAQNISDSFSFFVKFFEYFSKYSDENSIVAYRDVGGDGLSPDDIVELNIYDYNSLQKGLYIKVGNVRAKVDKLITNILIRPFLYKETRERNVGVFSQISKAFDFKNPDIKENERWINLKYLLSLIPLVSVPDTMRINPKNFFEGLKKSPSGFRSILPMWADLNGDGIPEFLVEAEAKETSQPFCFAPEDRFEKRFLINPYVEVRGAEDQSKYISILYSRGKMTSDFTCDFIPRLGTTQNYDVSISAYINLKKIELQFEKKELILTAFNCSDYPQNSTKLCYEQEGNALKPYFYFISSKVYELCSNLGKGILKCDLQKVFSNEELYSIFEREIIKSYIAPQKINANLQALKKEQDILLLQNFRQKYQNIPENVEGDSIYVAWIDSPDIRDYTVEILLPQTGESYPLFFSDNSAYVSGSVVGVWGCSSGFASCSPGNCENSTCLVRLGKFAEVLPEGYSSLCIRVKGSTKEGSVSSNYNCFEFSKDTREPKVFFELYYRNFQMRNRSEVKHELRIKNLGTAEKFVLDNPVNISRETNFSTDTCLFSPRIVFATLPLQFSSDGKIIPFGNPEVYLKSSAFSDRFFEEIAGLVFGQSSQRYMIENISFVRTSGKYKLFSALYTEKIDEKDKDIPRFLTLSEFPMWSKLVLGCSSIIPRCFFNHDSPHFPEYIISEGIRYSTRIKMDCQFPKGDWSYYYVLFRDPTFFGAVEVNLDPLPKCEGDPSGWITPDNYTLNKVTSDLFSRIVSPVVSVLANLIGLVTGQYQYINTGDICQ